MRIASLVLVASLLSASGCTVVGGISGGVIGAATPKQRVGTGIVIGGLIGLAVDVALIASTVFFVDKVFEGEDGGSLSIAPR